MTAFLWLGIVVLLGLGLCTMVWAKSPNARARVGDGRFYVAILVMNLPWALIASISSLQRIIDTLLGEAWWIEAAVFGLIMALWLLVAIVTKSGQTLAQAYRADPASPVSTDKASS